MTAVRERQRSAGTCNRRSQHWKKLTMRMNMMKVLEEEVQESTVQRIDDAQVRGFAGAGSDAGRV